MSMASIMAPMEEERIEREEKQKPDSEPTPEINKLADRLYIRLAEKFAPRKNEVGASIKSLNSMYDMRRDKELRDREDW